MAEAAERQSETWLESWRALRGSGRRMLREGFDSFAENDLLSFASAIAFQVMFALVPATLAAIALLGFLDLEEIWQDEVAPQARQRLEEDSYSVVERTVQSILGERRGLWLTFGLAFTFWQISGAIRATSGPLNRIYDTESDRPFWLRFLISFGLAAAVSPLIALAAVAVQLGPRLLERLDLPRGAELFVSGLRWPLAAALLFAAVYLIIRIIPEKPQTFAWAGVGSVFVVGSWLIASVVFGLYATYVADYGSVFGSLASVIVLMTYLYVAAVALLFGVQLDACVRREVRRRTKLERPE